MRSLRHELLSTSLVLSLPVALCLAIPFETIGFQAKTVPTECSASAAFISLSPEEEAVALESAKTSWQSNASAVQRMRVRLPLGELPDEQDTLKFEVKTGPLVAHPAHAIGYAAPAWEPSMKAKDSVRIDPVTAPESKPAFSREELLKIN